jgi:N-acyl-D-amino-acid deacylase
MTEFDTVIKGGTLIDGRNFPRRVTDLGISEGKIAKIGRIPASEGRNVIDASGLTVAPGVIDTHTHYDAQLFWDPYLTLSGWHGVTSVVIGNCGFGFAPAHEHDREYLMQMLTRVEAIPYATIRETMVWEWESFPQWLDKLDELPKGLNLLASFPLNPLLVYVMGLEAAKTRDATDAERSKMKELLREGMDAGACGWSAQMQAPGSGTDNQRDYDGTSFATDLMSIETAVALAEVLAEYEHGFIQASIADSDWDSVTSRTEALAKASQRPVLWNAVAGDSRNPTGHRRSIEWIRSCQERGIPVWAQTVVSAEEFIFTFEHFNMFDDSPAWRHATLGTVEERLAKFRDPDVRASLKDQLPSRGPDRMTILKTYSERFAPANGLRLPDAARLMGYEDIVDLLVDIVVEDELRTLFQALLLNDDIEAQAEVARMPYGVWGLSDGGAHTKFLTLGAYATEAIISLTRERRVVTLEEAHWRLSALPAECLGLRDRGTLVEGAAADVLVYDWEGLELLEEEIAHDLPAGEWRRIRRASGYRHTLVNGVEILRDDEFTDQHPGLLLRQGNA